MATTRHRCNKLPANKAKSEAVPSLGQRTRRATDILVLLAFCGFLFFAGLQVIGLVGADEPRYAQIAREMLLRQDWVTPVLFGHPWLEKPPLLYWGMMLSYKAAGGVFDWAARVPSAVLTSLMVAFIYLWARKLRPGMQLDAALITAASAMVIGFGRAASTDMPLTAMFTIALLSWYAWYASQLKVWLLVFYVSLGLATLAKGPVAVLLAGMILVVFLALRRDWRSLWRTLWPVGIAFYLAVTLPWFIAVQRANPAFFRVFILEHNVARFATDLYRHNQPFWYYLPVALLGFVPWTVFLIAAVIDAIRDWRYSVTEPAGREDLRIFLALWLLLPIAFFTFSHSKLPGYILPAIPAGTILLADFIRRREEDGEKPGWWLALLHALLAAALLVAAFIVPFRLAQQPVKPIVWAVAATLAVVCILSLILTSLNQGYRVLRFTTLVPVVIAFALTLKGTAPIIDYQQSARWVVRAMNQTADGPIPIVAVYDVPRALEYGLGFYRDRPVLSYERNEIPPGPHLVVAAAGAKTELEYRLKGRSVLLLGGFAPQHVDFYLVSGSKSDADRP